MPPSTHITPTTTMRIWTVQPLFVWERLKQKGTLRPEDSTLDPDDDIWQYEWLRSRLSGRPGFTGARLWWAYCARPDLRWVRHYRPLGLMQVRLEVEQPDDELLVMRYRDWHGIYTGQYLAESDAELAEWEVDLRAACLDEDTWPLPSPLRERLEASWERLFAPEAWPQPGADLQDYEAVFERLVLDRVKSCRTFVGANAMLSRMLLQYVRDK